MILPSRLLRFSTWLAAPLLATAVLAQGPKGKGKGDGGPLRAELYQVKDVPFARTVSTVGTLRANEAVTLVPELSRLIGKIEVKEGSDVAKGDLLFKLDDSDLQAQMGEILVRLKLATANKERVADLLPRKAISRQEFDISISELAVLEAQKETQAVEISKTEIRAPFAGRVGVRQVSEGAYVSPATPLITLQDLSRIKVDFPLPERYSGDVHTGQKFTFSVAGNGRVFEGVVTVIEPAIDAVTRSLLVRGVCESPKGLLPGGFAEVSLTLDGESSGFLVPSQAIVPSQRGSGIYVIREGKADLVAVETGVRTEDQVQILKGLEKGDIVATTNLLRMRPGSEVTAVKSQ